MQVMVKRPLIRTLVTPCPPPRSRLRTPPPATRGTDMHGRLIEWSVHNVFLVLVMALAIVAGGIYALVNTPLDAKPDLSGGQVIVQPEYRGQAPQVVEDHGHCPATSALLPVHEARDGSGVQ